MTRKLQYTYPDTGHAAQNRTGKASKGKGTAEPG